MTGKQIYPESITGKGAVAGGSVLDHAFGQSDPYTLGVDSQTGRLFIAGQTAGVVQIVDPQP